MGSAWVQVASVLKSASCLHSFLKFSKRSKISNLSLKDTDNTLLLDDCLVNLEFEEKVCLLQQPCLPLHDW